MSNPSRLPPRQQLVARGKWPLVGERTPRDDDVPWRLAVTGEVDRPLDWSLDELFALPSVESTVDIHCVTRWSKLDVRFRGVSLADVVALARARESARFVSFVARSSRGHSTSLPLAEASSLGTMLAWETEGEPLPAEHGGPLRVVVPGRYFYKSLKWLERIELLRDDRLGYWEAEAGYHNRADPWREERFIAPNLSRQEMQTVLAERSLAGRELRGLDARQRDLQGLDARQALLRDADFTGARLSGACFDGANLSNARFDGADLSQASFVGADLEGCSFAAAKLSGADLTGASLFGASFSVEPDASTGVLEAIFDDRTRIDAAAIEQLTPGQAVIVRQGLGQH